VSVVDIYTLQNYASISSTKSFTLVDNTTVTGRMQLNSPGSLGFGGFNLAVGSMSGQAPINSGGGSLSVGGDNTSSTYSGTISGSGSLTKTGSGTLTLTASDAYSGPTTINQGKLVTFGIPASAVTVNSGGTLAGTGLLSSVLVASGGHFLPDDPTIPVKQPGEVALMLGDLTLVPGAKMDYVLDSLQDSDQVVVPLASLHLSGQQFSDFSFTTLGAFGDGVYTLVEAHSITGTLGQSTGNINGHSASLSVQGGNLILTVVPEPSGVALLVFAGAGGMAWRQIRRRMRRIHTSFGQTQPDCIPEKRPLDICNEFDNDEGYRIVPCGFRASTETRISSRQRYKASRM
jgi:autotransporter-associated beta strand protein